VKKIIASMMQGCSTRLWFVPAVLLVVLSCDSDQPSSDDAPAVQNDDPSELETGDAGPYGDCAVPTRYVEGSAELVADSVLALAPTPGWAMDCDSQMIGFETEYGVPESRSYLDHFHTPGNFSGLTFFDYACAGISVGFSENFDTGDCALQLQPLNEQANAASSDQRISALDSSGLYERTPLVLEPGVSSDCMSQSDAFLQRYGVPERIEVINAVADNEPDKQTTAFHYTCALRVVWFEQWAGSDTCDISGMNAAPEYWGHHPYEPITGCG